MFKFLIYLFLIYILYRLVFGRMMGSTIKSKVFRFDTHHHYHNNTSSTKEEGSVTVNPKINKQKEGGNTPNIGEYVDYEEVK
ncbi:MAG: hypothetical protein V4590_02255 [Bacteroidota bacterium]